MLDRGDDAAPRLARVRALLEQVEQVDAGRRVRVVPVGVPAIDAALPAGGLRRGAVHEWIDEEPDGIEAPPLALLVQMARSALASDDADDGGQRESGHLIWVGRAVWPSASALAACSDGRAILARSLFVRAERPAARLWATEVALRSGAAAAVIADGTGFDLVATRRLQLAAEAGGALGLLTRPRRERHVLSAATTRWLVRPAISPFMTRRWTVELLRCKGVQPAPHVRAAPGEVGSEGAADAWILELDRATHALHLAADVLDRSGETTARPARRAG